MTKLDRLREQVKAFPYVNLRSEEAEALLKAVEAGKGLRTYAIEGCRASEEWDEALRELESE